MKKPIYISTLCVHFRDYGFLRELIDECRDVPLGLEYGTWWSVQPDLPELLDQQIEVFRDVPSTMHSPFYEIMQEEGSDGYKEMKKVFAKAVEQYHAFGCTSMVVHTNEGKFPREMQEFSIKRLIELDEYFHSEGIPMTVENVGYPAKQNCLFDYDDFVSLFDKLPDRIGCLIDTGHAMLNHWDIVKLIKTLGTRIKGYHLNSNDGLGDIHYPTFDKRGAYGVEQMEEIVKTLAEYSPDADIILEYMFGPDITKELMLDEIHRTVDLMESVQR